MTKFAMLSLLSTLGACADKPDLDIAEALEKTDGGFTTADESAAFGDAEQFAMIEADTPVVDTMANMIPDDGTAANHVLVMWGKVPPDRDATTVRDWSGTLSVSSGAVRATRAVAFEDRTDALLPRTVPEVVSFSSLTRPAADGLALSIIAGDVPATTPQVLTYANTAGDISYDIDLASLDAGPQRIDAGDGFQLVALSARGGEDCRGGFMRGRWHQIDDDHGAFAGRVVNRRGEQIGHVRGIYGHKESGEAVMFGKFIGADGKFLGILRGSYENGQYKARWIDRAGEHGRLGGAYFDGPIADDGRGGFAGRWAEAGCAQD